MPSNPPGGDYLSRIRARGSGEEPNVPSRLHDKARGEEFVRSLGIATNSKLRSFSSADSIDLSDLPDVFVLKPTFLSSSYGVMVLERKDEGFYDHLRRRQLTLEEIRAEQTKYEAESNSSSKAWVVESKAVDAEGAPVPDDWKFFTFQGRVGLIHRTIRGTPKNTHAFFEGDFTPISATSDVIWTNENIVDRTVTLPPRSWRSMLNIARRISVAVPSPFVRVDMYNTEDGPVFGEFTLVPGTFYYEDRERMSPVLSARMGQLWEEAERDLI